MTVSAASVLTCAGCGTAVPDPVEAASRAFPFRCPNADADPATEHILVSALDVSGLHFPAGYEPNPFVRYRRLSHAWWFAQARGMADDRFVAIVRWLDNAIGELDGFGFVATPFASHQRLASAVGQRAVWVKDESGNVSGSHKARHLAGIMVYLLVAEALGCRGLRDARLAIASCGNAALAAALVARAAKRPIDVFIPPDAPPPVVDRLRTLGASILVCERTPGRAGDPCYLAFKEAVRKGAVPFCCQGPENALTIEGGKTLAYEMAAALGATAIDAVIVQVGGGALASAVCQGLSDAFALGAIRAMPRIYTVQTHGAHPLLRAYERVSARLSDGRSPSLEGALAYAATHRREFMWPWEGTPRSLARGILDDETYDWLAVVRGMLETRGTPVVVDEKTLEDARDFARTATGVRVDHTGASGLAGLLKLQRDGAISTRETVAVIFSGAERQAGR